MYPVWEVPTIGPGIILGLIAAFHILPSHLSTSAMWFGVFIETKAYRENRPELLEFLKKFSLMLIVFSYIFGSLSGVGIWFSATVANPRGISGLIHNYVWGWATEWVFFIIEVLGILVYYYTFGKVDKKTHLKLGWIFAIGSWTTMAIIVGILAFMLSPGKWPETGGFFDGFFNQTYWTQFLTRTAFMFSIAAAYAIAVATRLENKEVRAYITRTASKWGIAGLIVGCVFFVLYLKTLPEANRLLISALVTQGIKTTLLISLVLVFLYFIFASVKPLSIRLVPAIVAIFVIFAGIWSAERARELLRKPYIIPQYMYSNQIIGHNIPAKGVLAETERMNEKGFLKSVPFVPEGLREIRDNNLVEAGRLLALYQCSACHTLNDRGLNPLPRVVKKLGFDQVEVAEGFLEALEGHPYIPPFVGTPEERKALAHYLVTLTK